MNRDKLYSRKDLLFVLLFFLLFLFVFRNFLLTDGIFFERDSTLLEIPARHLCIQLIKEGNFALWTDAYGNGQPFLANPKNAVFYPGTWLYLVLPFLVAFKIHYVVHVVLGWLGVYYLCKAYSLSEQASFLGASVFLFSGIFLSSLEFYNHVAALCWMPWIFLVLHRYNKKFLPRLALLAGLWSLLILAGTPFVIIVTGCFALIQTLLVRFLRSKRLWMLALSIVLAFCLSAAQLIPTLDLYQSGVREKGTSALWSLEPLQLFNFVFPHFLGNDRQPGHEDYWGSHLFERGAPLYYSFYLSFGVFILVFFGLKRPHDYRHRLFLILSLFFVVFSLGSRTPFYPLWKVLPPFSAIRYPVKFLVPVTFCLAILSALGFDRLFREGRKSERKYFSLVLFSALLAVLFLFLKRPLVENLSGFFVIDKAESAAELTLSLFWGFFLFFICSLLVFLSRLFPPGKKAAAWFFLGIIVFSLVSVNQFINPVVPIESFAKPQILNGNGRPLKIYREGYVPFAFKEEVGGTAGMYRYLRESLYPYYGLQFGVKFLYSRDFYNIYDKDMTSLIDSLESMRPENVVKVLRGAGCEYSLKHFAFPFLPSREIEIEGHQIHLQRLPDPLPSCYLVFDARKAGTFEEKIMIITMPDFDPGITAVVEQDLPLQGIKNVTEKDTVRALEQFQSRQRFEVFISRPALLILQGNYRKGWRAWIDGQETEVLKANLWAKAVFLPAGEHEVQLKYFPRHFLLGLIVSLVALALILGALIFIFVKKTVDWNKSEKKRY